MTPEEKYKELFTKMMYNISGHSNLVKRNNANKYIAILCEEVQKERAQLGFEPTSFWNDVSALATIKSKTTA
jgi:hypothetical protein